MSEIFTTQMHDFTVYGLRNSRVEVLVVPDLGAKIVSLVDLRTGRQWMWTPPGGSDWRQLPVGTPFHESSLVGADECLPTIAPCSWRGRELPDHGEVWSVGWTLDPIALNQGVLETTIRLPISPLTFQRKLQLEEASVELAYTLENHTDDVQEFVWAFHPLLTLQPDDELVLPPEVTQVQLEMAPNMTHAERGTTWIYPRPSAGIDLGRLDLGREGRAVKFFTPELRQRKAAIRNRRTGDSLRFEVNSGPVQMFGVWINRGGWNGYQHMAIEPTTGAPDALDVAVDEWRRFATVPARGVVAWSFQMHLA